MGLLVIGVVILLVWIKVDPLAALTVGVLGYLAWKQQFMKDMAHTLEYWKAREFDLKAAMQEAKEEDKDRRVRIREARATHRRRVVRQSKEMRLMDRMFTDEDRQNLRLMTPEQRATLVYKQYGLKPEVADAWLFLPPAELEKRRMGIDDKDVD